MKVFCTLKSYLFFLLFFCSIQTYATIVVESVSNAVNNNCNGAIDIAVVGNNGPYSFAWSNGTSGEDAHFLCPDTYTVTVTDIYGCEENLTIEIGGCALYINPVIIPGCTANNTQGSIVLNSSINSGDFEEIYWNTIGEESPDGIFTDEGAVNLTNGIYCVTIRIIPAGSSDVHCELQQCFYINTVSDCSDINYPPPTNPPVIINEASNGLYATQEYYELLVIGTGAGSCEDPETVDLRGFIIDDNNGDFSISPTYSPEAFDTGVATGHIRFKNIDRWKEVPVGSLILIYNNQYRTLSDDPEDSNEDMSYIVPITDDGLEGTLQRPGLFTSLNYFPFIGNYSPASWDAIPMYNGADAPQIRYPNGDYCHGISYGPSNKMTGGPHGLFVHIGHGVHQFFYLDGHNYLDKNDYGSAFVSSTGIQETPGYPNTDSNAEFIANLCIEGFINNEENGIIQSNLSSNEQTVHNVEERSNKESVQQSLGEKEIVAVVYPNPSAGNVTIELDSDISTVVTINIVTLLGQQVLQEKISVTEGKNTFKLDLKEKYNLVDGVLLMNVIDESSRHLIDIFKIVLVQD